MHRNRGQINRRPAQLDAPLAALGSGKRRGDDSGYFLRRFRAAMAAAGGEAGLTCALAAHQVLALRLVGVDGRDGHRVFSVGGQVLQDLRGLVVIQDALVRVREKKKEHASRAEVSRCRGREEQRKST